MSGEEYLNERTIGSVRALYPIIDLFLVLPLYGPLWVDGWDKKQPFFDPVTGFVNSLSGPLHNLLHLVGPESSFWTIA